MDVESPWARSPQPMIQVANPAERSPPQQPPTTQKQSSTFTSTSTSYNNNNNNNNNNNKSSASNTTSASSILNIVSLVLRVLTFIFLLVALIVLSVAKATVVALTVEGFYVNQTYHFTSFTAYRYLMSTIVIGFGYTLVQTGFSVARLTCGGNYNAILFLDFYGDKVISYLLATGAAAGFGLGVDGKRYIDDGNTTIHDFFTKGSAASSLVLIAFLFTAASSVLSSYVLPTRGFK